MGSGLYSADVYAKSVGATLRSGGDTFVNSTSTMSRPRDQWAAHPTLDPNGVTFRESRDSDEHPTSVPIAVLFDVTGSMHEIPMLMQKELPALFETLGLGGYVEHPQVMFGAVGDAVSDRIPLQVGQFESDNRVDEALGNIVLERGGGGSYEESYELALYFFARHVVTDSWEKRNKKGYLILIGDEHAYPQVKANEVSRVIGDNLTENISLEAIVEEVKEKWELFFVLPNQTSHYSDGALEAYWRNLVGQNFIRLDDPTTIAEAIAKQVGAVEASIHAGP